MATAPCKNCGQMISPRASACPGCGHPVAKQSRLSKLFLIALSMGGLLILLAAAFGSSSTVTSTPAATAPTIAPKVAGKNPQRDAQLQLAGLGAVNLKKASKDPESFEMKSVLVMPSGAACYEYRAKNSFNAMLAGSAIMTSKRKMLIQERDGNAFVKAWNSECTKGGGDELLPLLKQFEII